MAKIQNNSFQSQEKFTIPFNKYCVDSFKLLIDKKHFGNIDIPNTFTEISTNSGEEIREFKRNSLQVKYKDTTIYLGTFRKILREQVIDKIIILFSSKVAGNNYFNGITKDSVIDVLEYIKSKGYFDYDNVQIIYKNLYTKDIDIKIDFKLKLDDKSKIIDYNKQLTSRFLENHTREHLHVFTGRNKLGLQTYERNRSTIKKPFLKWYDKSTEIYNKHIDFFYSLPTQLQNDILLNFIYRFEFTLNDKKFMANFGVLNRLEDILEVSQSKWREVAKTLLNTNFSTPVKKIIKESDFTPTDKILLVMLQELHKRGANINEIRTLWTSVQNDKVAKCRVGLKFDEIYSSICNYPKEVALLEEKYETVKKFDAIFGLTS